MFKDERIPDFEVDIKYRRLFELIDIESLIDYITGNEKLLDCIIKELEDDDFIDSCEDVPVIKLVLNSKNLLHLSPVKVEFVNDPIERRDLLLWWRNDSSKGKTRKKARYPFYFHDNVKIYLNPILKYKTTMYRNYKLYFVDDIDRHSKESLEAGLDDLIEQHKRDVWPALYLDDQFKRVDTPAQFVRLSEGEIGRRRNKTGIDRDPDYIW